MQRKLIECDCFIEGLAVEAVSDEYFNCLVLTTWIIGKSGQKLPWLQRFKFLYDLLVNGRVFVDEMIFNQDTAYELSDLIKQEASKLKSNE